MTKFAASVAIATLLASALGATAGAAFAGEQSAASKAMDDILMAQVVERASDNGLRMEIVVRCSQKSIGILHFDKIDKE